MSKSNNLVSTRTFTIYLLVIFASVVVSILLLFDNNVVDGYELLWLLPFSFFIMSLFSIGIVKNSQSNVTMLIIWGGYIIRFILTPLSLLFGNYRIIFFQTVSSNQLESAILLMVYEIFIVFSLLALYLRFSRNIHLIDRMQSKINVEKFNNRRVHYVLFLLTLFCILVFIYIPELKNSFTWIFADGKEISNIRYDVYGLENIGGFNRVLVSLFIFIFNIIRYLIPVYLLNYVYSKFKRTKFTFVISLIICMLPFFVINESNIQPFIGLIINIIMMTKLDPENKNKIIKLYLIIGGVLLFSILFSKLLLLEEWQNTSGIEGISLTLNAYFPGVGNVAAAFNIDETNKLRTLFYDFINTIPFKNSIFPNITPKIVSLTHLFNSNNGTLGNIIPHISGARYYLGFILAPFLPGIVSLYSIRIKEKADASRDYWNYFFYVFYSIRIALIPTLYNHISFVSVVFNSIIPMYLIIVFIKKIK